MSNQTQAAGQESVEYLVPVVFDVTAANRTEAARVLAEVLDGCHEHLLHDRPAIEAWWFPEAQDKAIDRNDRTAMHLVSHEPGTLQDVADALPGALFDPGATAPTVMQHEGAYQVIVTDWDLEGVGMLFLVGLHRDDRESRYAEAPDAAAAVAIAKQFAALARAAQSSIDAQGHAA